MEIFNSSNKIRIVNDDNSKYTYDEFLKLYPTRKNIATDQKSLIYTNNENSSMFTNTFKVLLTAGDYSTHTNRNNIADNIYDGSLVGIDSDNIILVRINDVIYEFDISTFTGTIYYNNSVNTEYIVEETNDSNIYYYKIYKLKINGSTVEVDNTINYTPVAYSLGVENQIKYIDVYKDIFYLVVNNSSADSHTIIQYIIRDGSLYKIAKSYDKKIYYIRLLDSGEFIYFDAVDQKLKLLNKPDDIQNGIYIPDLPKIDYTNYDIFITRSGLVLYYTNGNIYFMDLKYPSLNTDVDINNVVYKNDIDIDNFKLILKHYLNEFMFVYDTNVFKTKIGEFINDSGHFITNHCIDIDDNVISETAYYTSTDFDSNVSFDEDTFMYQYSGYSGSDIYVNYGFIQPSTKYLVKLYAPDYTDPDDLKINFDIGGTVYSIDVNTDDMTSVKYIDVDFSIISSDFSISEIESVSYIKIYPTTTSAETKNIYLGIYV